MMANQNAAQATLTGELSALGPNASEAAEAPQKNYNRYLEAVTPELSEQMDIEAGALTGWLQFKTKNYLIRDIFAHAEAQRLTDDPEAASSEEPIEAVDPLDTFLSGDFNINLTEVRENIIIPELRLQQKAHLESSADIVGRQIPQLAKRRDTARSDHEALVVDATVLEQQYARFENHPIVLKAIKRARDRQKDVKDLSKDIDNFNLRAHVHDGMFAYINRLANGTGENGTLDETVDTVTHAAKLDVFREVIDLLRSRMSLLDKKSEKDAEEYASYERKIAVLEAERDAMLAVSDNLREYEEAEAQNEPETTIEMHPAPEQKRALVRIMGTVGMGTGFAKKMFAR